jgi:hypothetical protein
MNETVEEFSDSFHSDNVQEARENVSAPMVPSYSNGAPILHLSPLYVLVLSQLVL